MAISKEGRVLMLAELVGIPIADEDVHEVANRFDALLQEMDRLKELDLSGVEPLVIFPDEES